MLRKIYLDWKNNSFKSFIILFFYRIMNHAYTTRYLGGRMRLIVYRILKEIVFALLGINSQISYKAEIGENIRLLHSGLGVVISAHAIVKDNQTIYHQVTLGINENLPLKDQAIVINENCLLSVGCKVISCEIGRGTKVGPNAVVYKNLPENSLYVSLNKCINTGKQ